METYLRYFDNHRCLSQSEKSKCTWTHINMASRESSWKVPPGILRDRKGGGEEGMDGKLNGNYLTLIIKN